MKKEIIANNLYDLIKVCGLKDSQKDRWGELSRKHGEEAKRDIGKWLQNKEIEISGSTIKIGKRVKIIIEE